MRRGYVSWLLWRASERVSFWLIKLSAKLRIFSD